MGIDDSVGDRSNAAVDLNRTASVKKKNAPRFDTRNMQEQARKGSWRLLLENVKEARKIAAVFSPEERMIHTTYHILALAKLGNYTGAAEELAALGDLQNASFFYEDHPNVYPGISGSMVPFSLRWLHAAIPYRIGQASTSMERMYSLLDYCSQKEEKALAADGKSEEIDEIFSSFRLDGGVLDEEQRSNALARRWKRRKEIVNFAIINLHLGQKDYIVALRFVNETLARDPENVELWSKFAHVQLQLGDVDGAKLTFAKVEALVDERAKGGEVDSSLLCLVGRNKGLVAFVEKQYAAAVKAYNEVLEISPGDALAANNKALCLMYSRDLIRATQVLEDVLQKHTEAALNETLVLNLCSMYELAAINSNESKRKLSSWILQVAPDDFDLTCTRL
ncbi:trafficking protein particle complex subunit 12 isoform X2 [Selaginella moellendorffii]|uniref:trafficking protein particle complex subunit 12 isoform X1 n=1 Tax=Selaginella moellendorffii TaxID=88036 RepID=UPI000D1CBA43|nr:trafficking protein particle complex subunit 12 isoform X1 [Selaginella moellendorffii]XP_024537964.1 trafficking protein particle complex subunit 12 isoform X2 [Selaginella moellendorffii]|eukprot:XP_024537962.1 trafficking protein particle complex subunit 12 isoform X1 [Selaginella moellendorffii]